MKYTGTIVQVRRARSDVTLIVKTEIGLRGVELDRDLWGQILADFKVEQDEAVIGWSVEYDPAHGDLVVTGPDTAADSGADDDADPGV